MTKANIGIIGYGFVGQALGNGFKEENVKYYDKYKESTTLKELVDESEFIFITVPTPMFPDESGIDLSIIEETVKNITRQTDNTDKIVVIKSTAVPGTTARLQKQYPSTKFAYNPEFLRELSANEDFINADRTVMGAADPEVLNRLETLYKNRFPNIPFYKTDSTSAEMVKYMANTYLASKVMFAFEMYGLCQKLGIDYNQVKKMVVADKRIIDTHLDVKTANSNPDDRQGFGGKCFPKDTVALLGLAKQLGVDMSVLEAVWEKNKKIRRVHDWEEIPFVTSSDHPDEKD